MSWLFASVDDENLSEFSVDAKHSRMDVTSGCIRWLCLLLLYDKSFNGLYYCSASTSESVNVTK